MRRHATQAWLDAAAVPERLDVGTEIDEEERALYRRLSARSRAGGA